MGLTRVPVESQEEDERLVRLALEGDAMAYRGLVEKYQDRVNAVAYGLVRDREEARDIAQDTFVRAYRSLGSLRGESIKFRPWLLRIATNVAIDVVRKRNRRPVTTSYDDALAAGRADAGLLDENGPARELENKEIHRQILDALDELPDDQRQVLILREMEGLTYQEIAEVLGIAEGTVMSRLFYARKKLQKILVAPENAEKSGSATE